MVDIWLRSLRDIGQVAFGMRIAEPKRVTCQSVAKELIDVLEKNVKPETQIVLVLSTPREAERVHGLLKRTCSTRLPCPTQFVYTIRNRFSVAAELSRLVLQINVKTCCPLWNIEGEWPEALMVLGVSTLVTEHGRWLGLVASVDRRCSVHYSDVKYFLDPSEQGGILSSFFAEAVAYYFKKSEGARPKHVVVYRDAADAFLREEQALLKEYCEVLDASLTFVSVREGTQAFVELNRKENLWVKEGTFVETISGDLYRFALFTALKGPFAFRPYDFTAHELGVDRRRLLSLTYRLALMYWKSAEFVEVPAPLMYARKISRFACDNLGLVEPHSRLKRTMWYL
jgi:hypothetical protein